MLGTMSIPFCVRLATMPNALAGFGLPLNNLASASRLSCVAVYYLSPSGGPHLTQYRTPVSFTSGGASLGVRDAWLSLHGLPVSGRPAGERPIDVVQRLILLTPAVTPAGCVTVRHAVTDPRPGTRPPGRVAGTRQHISRGTSYTADEAGKWGIG
jgi:hypothetical protein